MQIPPKIFYQGKSGLAEILSLMEQAHHHNEKCIFVEKVTDTRILLILKDMGLRLDITSNRFTIIMWEDYDDLDEPVLHIHFIERRNND